MKLEVGCWHSVPGGYVGLDIIDFGQRYVQDARDGLPLPDDSGRWEQIRCHHFIEHLTEDEAMAFIDDCWGKCEELYIITPHFSRPEAYYLTHKTRYNEATFRYFERSDIGETSVSHRWEIKKLVVNNRKDIHVWMKPLLK